MEDIHKAESTKGTIVPTSNEIGQPRIITSSGYVKDKRRKELVMPQMLRTFDCMFNEEDSIYNSIDITNIPVSTALHRGKFVAPVGSTSGKVAAEYLNYCIRNMSSGTWLEAINNIVTDIQYGFSLLNLVVEKRSYGPYSGTWVIKKLAPRDQKSVAGWLWDKEHRELRGLVQYPSLKQRDNIGNNIYLGQINELARGKYYDTKYPVLRNNQLLHFTYNKRNNDPQGDSPLIHCYKAFIEKQLIEKYELIGVSKDLGGALVLKVPSTLIEEANSPDIFPNSKKEYDQLQRDAAKLHAGEASYIVLTSDVDEASKAPLYDLQFKGIDGGGKQYNTSDIINQKRKSMYNVFGTGFLLLGQESHGSYSLSTTATTSHELYIQRNVEQKVDVLNSQLAPRLLAANGVYLSYKDMPFFEPGDPKEFDPDVMSKFIQRVGSVALMTPEVLTHLYEKNGYPTEGIDKLDFTSKGESRAGESKGSSGTGNTQTGGKKSETNSENASKAIKNLLIIEEDDVSQTVIDPETQQLFNIPKDSK